MNSALEIVQSQFPKYKNILYTLPGPPEYFARDPLFIYALGHRTVVDLLETVQKFVRGSLNKGFLITQLLSKGKGGSENTDGSSNSAKLTDCCILISSLLTNKILLFKYIHFIRPDTLANTFTSLKLQLEAIEEISFHHHSRTKSGPNLPKIQVTILLFLGDTISLRRPERSCSKNAKNLETEEFYRSLLDLAHKEFMQFHFIDVEILRVAKPKANEAFDEYDRGLFIDYFKNLSNVEEEIAVHVEERLGRIVLAAPQLKTLEPLKRQLTFRNNPKETIVLNNEGLERFRSLYFPKWDQELITIPNFDRIKNGLLYVTEKDDGRLNDTKCNEFIGEMQNFWKDFIIQLEAPCGLLLKSFTNDHLNCILEKAYNEKFEVDWLYCSEDKIVVIEVGRTIKLEEPSSAVRNKLHQALYTLIPKLQYVIWYLCEHVNKSNGAESESEEMRRKIAEFLQHNFKVLIYFPNINSDKLERSLHDVMNRLLHLLKTTVPDLTWEHLLFLVPDSAPNIQQKLPILFKMQTNRPTLKPWAMSEQQAAGSTKFQFLEKLDSSVLTALFTKSNSSNYAGCEFASKIASLLAMTFFVNEKLQIEEFPKLPLTTDEKFLDEQQKFIKKEPDSGKFHLKQLNITLSPQQHRILIENQKLLLLAGEPGSGKTVLLLAKAFVAAQDPNVNSVFFYAPKVKTALKRQVDDFIGYSEYQNLFSSKFKYLSDEELFTLEDQSYPELHKSVLLVDEIYFEAYLEHSHHSDQMFNQKFFNLSLKVFPHLKNCWMANIVASSLSEDYSIMTNFFNYQFFNMEPLSVQYRSSSHIGTFSTNYLHRDREVGWSSVRVPGSFMSSQTQVSVQKYQSSTDLVFSFPEPSSDEEMVKNRWAIVFCEDIEKQWWEEMLQESGKFDKLFVTSSSTGCHDCKFSGGESIAVLIFIDHLPAENSMKLIPVLNLAITRAQSILEIYVKNEYFAPLEEFFKFADQDEKQTILMDARACLPIDFSNVSCGESTELLDKLYAIALAKSDRKLVIELRRTFKSFEPSGQVLVQSLRGWKEKKFLDSLEMIEAKIIREYWMSDLEEFFRKGGHVPLVLETIQHAIHISCKHFVEWIFNLIGDSALRKLLHHNHPILLFQACLKGSPSIMDILLKKLKKLDILQREIEFVYPMWNDHTTLLTLLCYGDQKLEAIKLIMNRGFPDRLLTHSFRGKNALQYAIEYNNIEVVNYLISKEDKTTKKPVLLSPSIQYCAMTAFEYAEHLGFHEVASCFK